MKHLYLPACFLLLAPAFARAQAISINTDASSPDPSAILDVKSSDKGVLVPRMTTAQRGAITAANALLVFDSDTKSFWFFDGAAAAWREIRSGNIATIADADGNTKVQVEKNPNEDMIRFDLGGTENMVLRKNAADMARLELKSPLANTFVGENAGQNTTSGEGNTANGWSTLFGNTTGARNTAVGREALYTNNLGSSNVAMGFKALYSNTGSSNLVAVGDEALSNNGVGASQFFHAMNNTAVGSKALFSNSTGSQNTAGGYRALYANTGGRENTAHGALALYANTTGVENTANGATALYSNTTGNGNTANGATALYSNTTGAENTANGIGALFSNTTGDANTAYGRRALYANTTGYFNTANGLDAMYSNTTGYRNTANGQYALYYNTTGYANTAYGLEALYSNTTGVFNTAIGAFSDVGSGNLYIATAIGYGASVACSNCMALGGTGVNAVKVGIGTATPELKLHVVGGSDAGLASGGYLQTGTSNGTNIVMDENEIMARNNGAASDLILNFNGGNIGIGRTPATNLLEVDGTASKSSAGSWLANSDARLKKNITPLKSQEMLDKLLALQGVTYEWNDDKTGSKRPTGIQYGFTAQNIQTVFPTLVEEDKLGYLQTAYGTYDAMTVEAIRALNDEIEALKAENTGQKVENTALKAQLDAQAAQLQKISAALQSAGIGVQEK